MPCIKHSKQLLIENFENNIGAGYPLVTVMTSGLSLF